MNRQSEPLPEDQGARSAPTRELRISVVDSIDEVSAADWDACANPTSDSARDRSEVMPPVQAISEQPMRMLQLLKK